MGTQEEEKRLRSLISLRRQGDSKGKPEGDREEWKKGLVFGMVWPWEVTLIELGRHGSNSVFINLRVHWISCEIWSLNGVVCKGEFTSQPQPLNIDRMRHREGDVKRHK